MILCLLATLTASGQNRSVSFDKETFHKDWSIESESPGYSCFFHKDTLEVKSPKGLTLWYKHKLEGDVIITYDACIRREHDGDRLSDLNCFWMATDPDYDDIWHRAEWRSGIFNRYYSLTCYYVGYGGNNNTTTRFRKYNGDYTSFLCDKKRPEVIVEYKDAPRLLRANHWYHIRIESEGKNVTFMIDNEKIVKYKDEQPLKSGWFGFRTTESRAAITNFNIQFADKR